MNKKEIDRVVKDLEFLNRELEKANNDKNYKPKYPEVIINEDGEEED